MLKVKINSLLDYIQPTKYIVSSEEYSNEFNTPVLTAGDTFLLGYTNDKDGIYNASKHNPIILFDDFTTAIKWVDFPFKVKSSACKIIVSKTKTNLRYCYYAMKAMNFDHSQHKRYWISEYSEQLINDYEDENSKIVAELDNITDTISKKEQVILNLDELIKSRFIEMFDGKYETKPLNEVCEELFAGGDVKKDKSSDVKSDKYPYPIYTNGEKDDGLYGYTSLMRVAKEAVTISGRGTIGFTCLRKEPFYPAVRLIVAVPNQELINGCYLQHFIQSKNYGGQGASIPQLTVPMIKNELIPIPPISVQNEFKQFVELIDKSKFIVQKEIKDLQELLDKKMDEYFGQ